MEQGREKPGSSSKESHEPRGQQRKAPHTMEAPATHPGPRTPCAREPHLHPAEGPPKKTGPPQTSTPSGPAPTPMSKTKSPRTQDVPIDESSGKGFALSPHAAASAMDWPAPKAQPIPTTAARAAHVLPGTGAPPDRPTLEQCSYPAQGRHDRSSQQPYA